jgi:hypothetical protein
LRAIVALRTHHTSVALLTECALLPAVALTAEHSLKALRAVATLRTDRALPPHWPLAGCTVEALHTIGALLALRAVIADAIGRNNKHSL